MKERSYSLDVIRVLACLMVIVMHSPIPGSSGSGTILAAVSYFTAPCIGLFFMVSGALLLPIKTDTWTFVKKRLFKVLCPTLFWTAFYLFLNIISGEADFHDILLALVALPFAPQGHGVLWFMYVMTGLYLLTPILSAWVEKSDSKTIKIYLLLWAVTLCLPFLKLFVKIPSGETFILYYFSGYAGYFLLGYYINGRKQCRQTGWGRKSVLWLAGIAITIIPPVVFRMINIEFDFYSLFWYLSIGVATMCLGWFKLIQKTDFFRRQNRFTIAMSDVSKMSFGIYLIHIFVMRGILWKWDFLQTLPYTLQIPLCTVLTFVISYAIIKCISKLSFSKYIIGC